MADLYVCPVCGETEDCACSDLSNAMREVQKAKGDVRVKLGALVVAIVKRAPAACATCLEKEPRDRCAMCTAILKAKGHINEAERLTK